MSPDARLRSTLPDLLAVTARTCGERTALVHGERTVTYAQLWDLVRRTAAGLVAAGLARGDRVAVWLDKRVETVAALFGAPLAGGMVVPVNPVLRGGQVGHVLADSGARVLVTSAGRLAALGGVLEETKTLELVVLVDEPVVRESGARWRVVGWRQLVDATGEVTLPRLIDVDPAAILYTSGSTGRPKGVVLSHRNLVAGADSVNAYLGNTADDVLLAVLPLSFDAGLSQLTTGFAAGARVVLLDYLLPCDVVRACARHKVTGITGVPPLWAQLAAQRWPEQARTLRYFASTGGRMPRAVLDRLRALFPQASPYLMYGLTEAFRSTYLDPAQVDRRPDSIGKAIPGAEILVVRPDGSLCDPGEEGELVHRGALVALGYWNDPELTATRFRPAPGRPPELSTPELAVWSGDRVVRDEEGFLYFVGRADEMIKTSGYRVSPTEVEEAAYDTGLVAEAVAFGRDDPVLGQAVVLVVTPSTVDTGALLEGLRARLARFQLPAEVVARDALPRSPNGKFDRVALRRELGPAGVVDRAGPPALHADATTPGGAA